MMRGVTYMANLEKELLAIKEQVISARAELGKCDKSISGIIHEAETRKANAYEGWALYKELSEVAQKRRAWKTHLHELEYAFNEMGGEKKLKQLEKSRKRNIKRYTKRDSWYDNFSPEALAILEGNV